MSATLTIDQWLTAVLRGDTTLTGLVAGVWEGAAPQGTTGPFVVVEHDSSFDTNRNGGHRVLSVVTFTVRVIDHAAGPRPPAKAPMAAAFARLDALLHNPGPAVLADGSRVNGVVRTGETRRTYTVDGVVWSELGATYRAVCS